MIEQNVVLEYAITINDNVGTTFKAESIDNIYSPFFDEKVFIVLNPDCDLETFLYKAVAMCLIVNGDAISEWIKITAIDKTNNTTILRYSHDNIGYEKNLFSFVKDLYLNYQPTQKVWKGFDTLEKMQYLYTMLSTVSWERPHYPKEIVLDGNEIDGSEDLYCELGFLLNYNQWGYFGWNYEALRDCLGSLPKNTKIIWKNYSRSRILINACASSDMGVEIAWPLNDETSFSDDICELFGLYIDFERRDE